MPSLYNTYRPQNFAEIIGQDAVVHALSKDVEKEKPYNAYLFYGPRGCGKTSTARIFAKALNCMSRLEGDTEPCNICDSCVAITNGNSADVYEYNAANHSGVDDMRKIMSKIDIISPGRYKVYILDEIHQLSSSAVDASLKPLEEPPENVVFILATTEPHKVKDTLRSRCKERSFSLVPNDVLTDYLGVIAGKEGLDVSGSDIEAAVRRSRGSVRDALSALDAKVDKPDLSHANNLVTALSTSDLGSCFGVVASATALGLGARPLAEQTLELLRECFLTQMGAPELTSVWRDNEEMAKALGPRNTVKAMEMIGESVVSMRMDFDARVNLEIALARYCKS